MITSHLLLYLCEMLAPTTKLDIFFDRKLKHLKVFLVNQEDFILIIEIISHNNVVKHNAFWRSTSSTTHIT